jgi:hypothetical protein
MQQFRFGPSGALAAAFASVWLVVLPQGSSENYGHLASGAFESCRWPPQLNFCVPRNQDTVVAASGLSQGVKRLLRFPLPFVLATLDPDRRMLGLRCSTSISGNLRGGCNSGIGDDEPSSVQVEESLDEDQVGPTNIQTKRDAFNNASYTPWLSPILLRNKAPIQTWSQEFSTH